MHFGRMQTFIAGEPQLKCLFQPFTSIYTKKSVTISLVFKCAHGYFKSSFSKSIKCIQLSTLTQQFLECILINPTGNSKNVMSSLAHVFTECVRL